MQSNMLVMSNHWHTGCGLFLHTYNKQKPIGCNQTVPSEQLLSEQLYGHCTVVFIRYDIDLHKTA